MVECSGHPCIRVKMPMRGRSGSTQFSDVELEDSSNNLSSTEAVTLCSIQTAPPVFPAQEMALPLT